MRPSAEWFVIDGAARTGQEPTKESPTMSTTRVLGRHATEHDDSTRDEPLDPAADRGSVTPARHPSRRAVRVLLAAIALSLGGAALHVADGETADRPSTVECSHPGRSTAAAACNGLWDRVRALGLPEHEWASAAEAMGLFPRDGWISDDGLRWEHLDGRSYVVATPQRSGDRQPNGS
jgi:hypothetical protein